MNGSGFEIRVLTSAKDELRRLDLSAAEQIAARLNWLSEHADEMQHHALKGSLRGLCRLRSGDYRVLYQVLVRERVIIVHAVGDRRDVYRKR